MKYFDTKFPIHFLQKPQMRITSISPVRKKLTEQQKNNPTNRVILHELFIL
jgi:hypothetical protein